MRFLAMRQSPARTLTRHLPGSGPSYIKDRIGTAIRARSCKSVFTRPASTASAISTARCPACSGLNAGRDAIGIAEELAHCGTNDPMCWVGCGLQPDGRGGPSGPAACPRIDSVPLAAIQRWVAAWCTVQSQRFRIGGRHFVADRMHSRSDSVHTRQSIGSFRRWREK